MFYLNRSSGAHKINMGEAVFLVTVHLLFESQYLNVLLIY